MATVDTPPLEELYRVDQVRAILNVSRRTIYRLVERGDLPVVLVGGQFRFERSDVRRFVDRQRRRASGGSP